MIEARNRAGDVVGHVQDRVPKSTYQQRLDEDGGDDDIGESLEDPKNSDGPLEAGMRFWSDFNRMYYLPRSIQAIPEADHEFASEWTSGRSAFDRYQLVSTPALSKYYATD